MIRETARVKVLGHRYLSVEELSSPLLYRYSGLVGVESAVEAKVGYGRPE